MIHDRHLSEPTPYAGREITLGLCERMGIPFLIVDGHGDSVILRSATDLATRGKTPETHTQRTEGEASPMCAGFKSFSTDLLQKDLK